jgi:hypothetical protein
MLAARRRELPRYLTLCAVLIVHAGLIAALLTLSRMRGLPQAALPAVALLYLPAKIPPQVRAENSAPRRLRSGLAITALPPALDAAWTEAAATSGPSTSASGSGVDWVAEAHRALQAFEIRSHQPPSDNSLANKEAVDDWWPQAHHHAGDKFKTANGDWIVWISANCYRVARSGGNTGAADAASPQAVCLAQPRP